ncbi:hypothetical protein BDN70DRAFT_892674 [Pholiota conissans]|uniref:Uncharacterized protein n=1 Tax=Pholiota conissans TaxID=109636 RepID=A0A9P6D456_9AGAR|nr:hypothetical protein BDN70DRAFT_892674 [Pholiota conissans]
MSAVLVSKPASISFGAAPYAHRRHPSAPVVVQPTRTPGVFSVKQKALTPARHQSSAQRPSNAGAKPATKQGKGPQVVARLLTPAPVVPDKKPQSHIGQPPSTPTPQSRGRAHVKSAKDKAQAYRSASHSSIRGKHGRQPSPPITTVAQSQANQTPSQAEVSIISTNVFDPFLDSPSTSLLSSPPPSPTLARPSGNLARRRNTPSVVSPSPVPSKAIPVPSVGKRHHYPSLSRSDPVPSHMQRPRPINKRSSTLENFPICDDLNEAAADDYPPSPPSTPSRPSHSGGPRTAPISARNPGGFPFTKLEMPTPSRPSGGKRHHRRVPSEGVFNMSSDEDVSTGPEGSVSMRTTLFNLMNAKSAPARFSTPVPSRALPRSREQSPSFIGMTKDQQRLEREAASKAGFFASSMFQNSPSPEELPDPLLL